MRTASSLALIALLTSSPRARAETTAPLVVERGAGAERCPDAETLGTQMGQIRGRRAEEPPNAYRVTFTRTEEGFSAAIRSDRAANHVRTLEHNGTNCSVLGHAVALTLALLLDSDIEPQKKVEPPPPPPSPPAAPPAEPSTSITPPTGDREITVSLAAVGLAGVLRPVAPAFAADVGVSLAPLRASVGALWGWPQSLPFGPGMVHERLLSGFARLCVPAWQRPPLRLDACSGVFAGTVTAEGEGYTRNERHTRTWIAVPLEAAFAGWSSPLGWELSLAALLPLLRPDYTIDGLGTVYASPPIGGMLSFRLIGILPW